MNGKNRIVGRSYDADGDATNDGRNTYTYDAENRIVGMGTWTYYYDAEGRRVGRSSGGSLTSYLLGLHGEQLTEVNASGWAHSNLYAGGKLVATYEGPAGTEAQGYYFHLTDWLGTERVQTYPDGELDVQCPSFPFGDGPPCQHATEQQFTGKERDAESGNDYFGARYYASTMGRFLSPDPLPWIAWQNGSRTQQQAFEAHLANPQDLNMYSYVLNNPLSKTDPTGMNACGTSNKDSSCTVTVTLQDRNKVNGHYSDQFSNLKGNGDYNATATVTVSDHGKVIGKGTFLASTVPSGKGFATIKNGTYSGTRVFHDHHAAILLNGGGAVPVVGGVDPATGKSFATRIYVHIAGWMEPRAPLGLTGMTMSGHAVSQGCQLICTSQYGSFENVTGLNASPPQRDFTVTVDTSENQ